MSPSIRTSLLRWWGWLLLTTIAMELAVATRYFEAAHFDQAAGSVLFRITMLIAHFTVLSAVALAPALIAALLRAPRWLVLPLGTLLSIATLIALLIDTQVYLLYRFHINAGVMSLLLGGAAGETFDFSGSTYAQAAAVVIAISSVQSFAAWLCWRWAQRRPGAPLMTRAVTAALAAAIVSFHAVHVAADAAAYEPLLEQTDVLPLRYAATAKRSLRALGVNVRSQPVLARSQAHDRTNLAYPLQAIQCRASRRPPSIILILIDSWRFDAMNAQTTPHLEKFAHKAVRFMDHHSGGNATRIGVFSLFYSIPGTYWHRMLAERQGPVLVSELLRQRYDVQAFRSAPLFSPEFDRTVFAQVPRIRMRSDGENAAERDRDAVDDFLAYLRSPSADRPFFALLFFDSPHKLAFPRDYPLVFRPSAKDINYLGLDVGTDPAPLLNRYRNSVHYVDSLIGEVLAEIEARGLLETSVIVVTGDHGQEFNDNHRSYWGHGSNFTRYQTGVPFLLYAPGLKPAVQQHRTTHFDVAPTLMREHLGCHAPFATYSVGRPLLEPGGRETMVLSEYADFAIVTADRIAVVREQGMQVLDTKYSELGDRQLSPSIIEDALEQKSRFLRQTKH